MYGQLKEVLQKELTSIEEAGLFKKERIIITPQGAAIRVSDGREVIIFAPTIILDSHLTQKLLKPHTNL